MTESFVTLFGLKFLTRIISQMPFFGHIQSIQTLKFILISKHIELHNDKSDGLCSLVSVLLKDGIPMHGVGFQSHFIVSKIPKDLAANMQRLADL
jgi:GH35 family endo-1,4-beta-xylanase